jgi:UV DNA damage endonuclease
MNLGYACINMTLSKDKITTNRSMIKKTFLQKGINYCSELALLNVIDMEKIVHWNVQNGIYLFRTSSNVFPWGSEYDLETLPHIDEIKTVLKRIGDYARENGVRLTCHPGPFNVLGSPNPNVIKNTMIDLELHGRVFDMMGLTHSPYNKINIHCNGTYGDKVETLKRWCSNFNLLSDSVKTRLTIENDDKASMYSVKDLMQVHECVGIPIVFDYHHHQFCTGDMSEEQALKLAYTTWPDGITPSVHYSESKALHENNSKIKMQAHSDYINKLPDTYGLDVDIMVEAKMKELAILPFITN